MDRAQISALLDRTQRVLTLASQAQEALRLLSIKQVVQVTSKGELGPDGNVSLIAPSTIGWPENLFALVFVDGLHAETTIKNFLASMAVIPGLYQQVRSAQGGLLSRLFNPFKSQAGDQAAFDLMVKLDELSPQRADVSRLVEGVHAARDRQAQGVEIFPGVHGLGERYLESARPQLAGAIGISTPHFESWDAAKLSQARRVVQRYSNDPNSEFRLKGEAEKCLEDLNAQRVEILVEILLRQLPVDALRTATSHRLRFGSLDSIHVSSVADVLRTHESVLTSVPGIGPQTAQRMKAAAQTLKQEALGRQTVSIGEDATVAAIELVRVLARFDQTESLTPEERARRSRVLDYVFAIPPSSQTYIVVSDGSPEAKDIFDQFTDDIRWIEANPNLFYPQSITTPSADIWQDYLNRPAHYQGLLATLLGRDVEGADELLDQSTLQRIRELKLDATHVKDLHLRGYQSFGARFAIVQNKGD